MLSTDKRGLLSQKNFVDEYGAFDCEVQSVTTLVSVVETVDDNVCGLDKIIDANQYSSLKILFMVTCLVLKTMSWQRYKRQIL